MTSLNDFEQKEVSVKKRKPRERNVKVNVRRYRLRKKFNHEKDFDDWLIRESSRGPWYLCSTYQAGIISKRIYACSFRKRTGYKKCERQLMVLFYPNGSVEVKDSSSELDHFHEPINFTEENKNLRTVITLRSPAEFSSWMAKQRERFAWHRRAGRRPFANSDCYQCVSVGSDGSMCKRIMHVEYTPENGVIVKELENLCPHESEPAHRKPSPGSGKPLKRQKRADSDSEYVPSTSTSKPTGIKGRRSMHESAETDPKRKMKEEEREEMGSEKTELNDVEGKSVTTSSIEDFVIIPDEEYEMNSENDEVPSKVKGNHVKKELERTEGKSKSSFTNERASSKNSVERDADSPCSSRLHCWKNGIQRGQNEAKQQADINGADRNSKYDLETFAEELASKLSKTPLERMAEIRESVRREMDEVFARQIVKEIASRSYSSKAQCEVLDRIRNVLRLA